MRDPNPPLLPMLGRLICENPNALPDVSAVCRQTASDLANLLRAVLACREGQASLEAVETMTDKLWALYDAAAIRAEVKERSLHAVTSRRVQ